MPKSEDYCPGCGHEMEFGQGEVTDYAYIYPCSCPNCGFEGNQEYLLEFNCITDLTGEEVT